MFRSPASKPTTTPFSNAPAAKASEGASVAATLVLALLHGYKLLISPLFAGSCRYYPSCADYMKEAVVEHGAARGTWLGLRRLSRCHPLGSHGFDPVPPGRGTAPPFPH
ncbi:MAG: membrane protein insertion efficiency factor YidD [Acidobacteria bacterium]|nr:membrane protein insertion efficiency factor YidD [Acidobacteriota bacterium]